MQPLSVVPRLFLGAALLAALACDSPASNPVPPSTSAAPGAPAAQADVLVTVNGVPVLVPDLHYVLAREDRGRARGADAAKAKAALEKLIDQELTRQQAVAMGLDTHPDYLRKLRFMEAPLNDFKRTTLTEAFYQKQVAEKSKVDDAEAREYFEKNSDLFKTEVHVLQILVRNDDTKIGELKQELDRGAPFARVAAKLFPADLGPSDKPPWDLGWLRYNQVPLAWREALETMKEGEVSEILRGPKNRAWIISLVERRKNDTLGYDQVKAEVVEMLQNQKLANLGERTLRELRSQAKIEYLREPGAMPAPPEPED
jgi:peptidyl-prolyl cis-trans isomerase C